MQSSWRLRGRLACVAAGTTLAAFGFASTASADVAIFDNADYVDTANDGVRSESDNLQATVDDLMVPFSTFTGLTAAEVDAAIAGRRAVLIPEQENASIAPDPAAADVVTSLRSYVDGGGTLVVFGSGGGAGADLINAVAGITVSETDGYDSWKTDLAAGTRFADGPDRLPENNRTNGLALGSLPANAVPIYEGDVEAPVVVIPFGGGEIVYLGYDWYNASPIGKQDGGWVDVLNRAVPGPRRSASIADAAQPEGDAGAAGFGFTVSLSSPAVWTPVTVRLATATGTADNVDIFPMWNWVTIPPGQTSTTVLAPVIGDTTVEPDETFTATLSAATPGLAIARATATGTILNDDAPGDQYPARLDPASFTAKAAVKRDRKAPFQFVVRGKVGLPSGVTAGDGCTGFVVVRLHRGKATQTRVRPVASNCTYRTSLRVGRKGNYRAVAVFLGNHALKRVSAKAGTVRAG